MFVSSVKASSLIEFVAIEGATQPPSMVHFGLQPLPGGLLFRRQGPYAARWDDARNRFAVARDNDLFAGFHFADAPGEGLVGVAEGDGFRHGTNVARYVLQYNRCCRIDATRAHDIHNGPAY